MHTHTHTQDKVSISCQVCLIIHRRPIISHCILFCACHLCFTVFDIMMRELVGECGHMGLVILVSPMYQSCWYHHMTDQCDTEEIKCVFHAHNFVCARIVFCFKFVVLLFFFMYLHYLLACSQPTFNGDGMCLRVRVCVCA